MRMIPMVHNIMVVLKGSEQDSPHYTVEKLADTIAKSSDQVNVEGIIPQVRRVLKYGIAYGLISKRNGEYFWKGEVDGQAREVDGLMANLAQMEDVAGMFDMVDMGQYDEEDEEVDEETDDDLEEGVASAVA